MYCMQDVCCCKAMLLLGHQYLRYPTALRFVNMRASSVGADVNSQ